MTLHLTKVAYSSESAESLRRWRESHDKEALLTTRYLSLRLHLWALAQADEGYAQINAEAFDRYLDGLAALVSNAQPDLSWEVCRERAADIVVIQNSMWLTALLGVDEAASQRSIARTEEIAFAPLHNHTG